MAGVEGNASATGGYEAAPRMYSKNPEVAKKAPMNGGELAQVDGGAVFENGFSLGGQVGTCPSAQQAWARLKAGQHFEWRGGAVALDLLAAPGVFVQFASGEHQQKQVPNPDYNNQLKSWNERDAAYQAYSKELDRRNDAKTINDSFNASRPVGSQITLPDGDNPDKLVPVPPAGPKPPKMITQDETHLGVHPAATLVASATLTVTPKDRIHLTATLPLEARIFFKNEDQNNNQIEFAPVVGGAFDIVSGAPLPKLPAKAKVKIDVTASVNVGASIQSTNTKGSEVVVNPIANAAIVATAKF